jgi:hypothetical protein
MRSFSKQAIVTAAAAAAGRKMNEMKKFEHPTALVVAGQDEEK